MTGVSCSMYVLIISFLAAFGVVAAPSCTASPYAVTDPLPMVNFPLPQSWAGEIPIGAPYGNDTLFFWLWEAQAGACSDDLIIWLNGGPGCTSLLGLFKEHGPILFPENSTTPQPNPFSWTKLANVLYVDQPVGTGFSNGNHGAANNDDDTAAFVQWLGAFFAEFPALQSKKTHILGESYAGIFVPYIANAIQQQQAKLGIKITSIGLGDSAWGNPTALTDVVATSYVKRHLNNYGTQIDPNVLSVLEQADIDCGFSAVLSQLTYPPAGKILIPGNPEGQNYRRRRQTPPPGYNPSICDFTDGTHSAAEVAFIINGTSLADGCYGSCATFEAAYNYFADFKGRCFNTYNIDTDCNNPLYTSDGNFAAYLNLPAVQVAIHAPKNFSYTQCNATLQSALTGNGPHSVPPAYSIIPSLLASGVRVNMWSGSLDYILNPIGTELSIQNMTWNGAQGFYDKPDRKWYDSQHNYAGVWGAERGLGYSLFHGAGHRTAQDKPAAAFTMVRDRVIGDRELPWY